MDMCRPFQEVAMQKQETNVVRGFSLMVSGNEH